MLCDSRLDKRFYSKNPRAECYRLSFELYECKIYYKKTSDPEEPYYGTLTEVYSIGATPEVKLTSMRTIVSTTAWRYTASSYTWSSAGLDEIVKIPVGDIHALYTIKTQTDNFRTYCPSFLTVIGGINDKNHYQKGHLVPAADYEEKDKCATYHYFNGAPQWNRFNNGNWRTVENKIRSIVNGDVFTGTFEFLLCPENQEKLHIVNPILSNAKHNIMIPIPYFFYKIVHPPSPSTIERPIIIATINHPAMTLDEIKENKDANFCLGKDICPKLDTPPYAWFGKKGLDCSKLSQQESGYTFVCEYNVLIQKKLGLD